MLDSPWAIDYEVPPLRYVRLGLEGRTTDPNHGQILPLSLKLGNSPSEATSYVLESSDPREMIDTLNRHLAEIDPDVILSDWGDSYLFPRLTLLPREPGFRSSSRAIRRGGSRLSLPELLHLRADDLSGRGAVPLRPLASGHEEQLYPPGTKLTGYSRSPGSPRSRFSGRRAARSGPLSSMQLDFARKDGILIPSTSSRRKISGRDWTLSRRTRGGIVYEPEQGWHERVGELDFVSMYPAIMVHYNVSPETVNCACCPDHPVPEIGHHLCRKRGGWCRACWNRSC